MWLLSLAAALAAPPADLDLEAVDQWDESASMILDGPAGCWEVVGHAEWDWNLGRFGSNRGASVFSSRLEDGVWGEFFVHSEGEFQKMSRKDREDRVYSDDRHFFPMVGRTVNGEVSVGRGGTVKHNRASSESRNALISALDRITGDVDYATVDWSEALGAVVLHRVLPIAGNNANVNVDVMFPGGGVLPKHLEANFPDPFKVGRFPRMNVQTAHVEIDGQHSGGRVFPRAETFSFKASVLGFNFSADQTVSYRSFRKCVIEQPVVEEAAEATAVPAPVPAPEAARESP